MSTALRIAGPILLTVLGVLVIWRAGDIKLAPNRTWWSPESQPWVFRALGFAILAYGGVLLLRVIGLPA